MDHVCQITWSHEQLYPRITVSKSHKKYFKACGFIDPFFKNILTKGQWLLDDLLTPLLLRSHVWLCPRIIVSKSHGNTSMYVDRVVNFAKHTIYYKHTLYRMSDHIATFWTKFGRDKNSCFVENQLDMQFVNLTTKLSEEANK